MTSARVAAPSTRPHLPPPGEVVRDSRSRRRTPLAWLPWVLGALLLGTLLLTALLVRAADGTGSGSSAESAATGGGTSAEVAAAPLATASGADVLGSAGDLRSVVGQPASGTAVVQSVVADEGFWVGPSAEQRVFVFLTPQARQSAGESGFQVTEGQTVRLEGAVRPVSEEFARTAGVTEQEGAAQLLAAGGFVEATGVALSG